SASGGAAADRSRRTQSGGSSRVSVAPRQRTTAGSGGARDVTPAQPEAEEVTPRQPTQRTDPRTSTPRGTGASDDRGTSQPTPTQPGASASPRLRGMLHFLPDFLRPELSLPAASPEEEAA
ncbi:MAG: hypothetical protein AAFY88_01185, partial [Acidobacteriota bacterium]